MAFTRYYDDPDRIMKKLQESTSEGMYQLNQPGNGERPPFIVDPSILLQKWGANLCEDRIDLESELRGTRLLSKDIHPCPKSNPQLRQYSAYKKEVTSASRALLPVWVTRDVEQTRWYPLQTDPQRTAIMPFSSMSSRLMEKDR
jgi:hypothetical protein